MTTCVIVPNFVSSSHFYYTTDLVSSQVLEYGAGLFLFLKDIFGNTFLNNSVYSVYRRCLIEAF
jgi:hypothetical protein